MFWSVFCLFSDFIKADDDAQQQNICCQHLLHEDETLYIYGRMT